MQEELPEIEERGEIKISDNKPGQGYARWEDINKAIKPVLKKHGFALSFRTGLADGKITVTGILSHEAGHSEETTMHLPADTSGSKNAVQAVGSSTSYGKRYTAAALLNITTRGGDDDGRAAGGNAPISEEQAERILDMLTKDKADVPGFCKYIGTKLRMPINNVLDIPAKHYSRALEIINTRSQKVQEKTAGAK
jgi:hypothetical protein